MFVNKTSFIKDKLIYFQPIKNKVSNLTTFTKCYYNTQTKNITNI